MSRAAIDSELQKGPVAIRHSVASDLVSPRTSGASRRSRLSPGLRRLHFWVGALFTACFLLLIVTGLMVGHRDLLALEQKTVSRRWLPRGYRPQDPDSEIRADIVLTDLHSGKLFGPKGPLLVDGAAAAWLIMMISGYGIQIVSRYRNGKNT